MMVEAMVVVAIGSRWIGVDAQSCARPTTPPSARRARSQGAITGFKLGMQYVLDDKALLSHDATGASCGTVTIGGVTYAIPPISSWDVSNVVGFKGVFADSEYAD